ncbi:putative mfs sugar [Phaeomoniella chlamydospora]|uniref:Putative mfs sugar n=1 Tax=Phaeomoniella chlamydospora TaxID=158046 RepID=A0A0G2EF34_PHACM|nr:putative mfs sugar [Phaeomoniella chlamydospora]
MGILRPGHSVATARIFLVVLPGFLLYGYNQSCMGGVLSFDSFTKTFPQIDTANTEGAVKKHNSTIQGTVVAIYTLGCLIGALGTVPFGNRLGRRKSLVIVAFIALAGVVIQASSFSLPQLIVGRILGGIGTGGVNAIVPVWQSECTKPKSRGKNVIVLGTFIAIGVALASWINLGLSFVEESQAAWRFPLALPSLFTLMLAASTFVFPESPRWLISKGRIEEAKAALMILEGQHAVSEAIDQEIDLMQRAMRQTRERGFIDIFRSAGHHQRLIYRFCLAFGANFFALMTGANAITYYATTIFKESLGFDETKARILAAAVLTWKIVAAFSSFLLVDRVGRKPLFLASYLGMGVAMAGVAGTVSHIESYASSIAAVFFIFFFMIWFPLGSLGANFLYSAEIAPQDLRVHLAAIGTATHWLFNFVIAEATPTALDTIGWKYYTIFAAVGFVGAAVVILFYPETKGKSLEEMDDLFSGPAHWWNVAAYARTMGRSEISKFEDGERSYEKELNEERVEDTKLEK